MQILGNHCYDYKYFFVPGDLSGYLSKTNENWENKEDIFNLFVSVFYMWEHIRVMNAPIGDQHDDVRQTHGAKPLIAWFELVDQSQHCIDAVSVLKNLAIKVVSTHSRSWGTPVEIPEKNSLFFLDKMVINVSRKWCQIIIVGVAM